MTVKYTYKILGPQEYVEALCTGLLQFHHYECDPKITCYVSKSVEHIHIAKRLANIIYNAGFTKEQVEVISRETDEEQNQILFLFDLSLFSNQQLKEYMDILKTHLISFEDAFSLYEKGETIISMVTGNEYHKSLELRFDGEDVDDVTSWFMPREIRGFWTVKKSAKS
jgi:hypothetical protein